MTTFDKREQGFENEFIHNEEMRFKAAARCNMWLGNWAAEQLGLKGDAAIAYANGVVTAGVDHGHDSVLLKVSNDLKEKGITQQEITAKLADFRRAALAQIRAEG